MGNELATIGGGIATAATSVAAGVTFGQVDALNNAVVDCAKFTGNAFMDTTVVRVGETVGMAGAVVGTSVASAVTLGQCDAVNNAVKSTAKQFAESAERTGNHVVNSIPVVGHVKGGIHYLVGDTDGGNDAMLAASTAGLISRTTRRVEVVEHK